MGQRIDRARKKEQKGQCSFLIAWMMSRGEMETEVQFVYAIVRTLFYLLLPVIAGKLILGYGNSGGGVMCAAFVCSFIVASLSDNTAFFKRFTATAMIGIISISWLLCSGAVVIWLILFDAQKWIPADILLSFFFPGVTLLIWCVVIFVIENITESDWKPVDWKHICETVKYDSVLEIALNDSLSAVEKKLRELKLESRIAYPNPVYNNGMGSCENPYHNVIITETQDGCKLIFMFSVCKLKAIQCEFANCTQANVEFALRGLFGLNVNRDGYHVWYEFDGCEIHYRPMKLELLTK